MPLNAEGQIALERHQWKEAAYAHRSLLQRRLGEMPSIDSLRQWEAAALYGGIRGKMGKEENWSYSLRPVLDIYAGYSSEVGALYRSGGGLDASLSYKDKWSFYIGAEGGLEEAPGYIRQFVDSTGVLPSLGPLRGTSSAAAAMAYFRPGAEMSYRPSKYFQFDLGFGNQHLGSGYRSLLLSEVGFAYPYFKISTDVWRFRYTNLFAAMNHYDDGGLLNREPKYSATHYLSWAATPRLSIAIFENIMWQGRDSLSQRSFDPHYLNPVIFYRPVEFDMGSPDRVLVGADISYLLVDGLKLYTQIVLDEFLLQNLRDGNGWWANKWGIQAGFTAWDILGWRDSRLQMEYNVVRPFTYSHGSEIQSYTHFKQPLAHPLGSNFHEFLIRFDCAFGEWFVGSHTVLSRFGRDGGPNLGGNLFRSYNNPERLFGNTIAQGELHELWFQRLSLGRIVYAPLNLRLALHYTMRLESIEGQAQGEHFGGISLSTSLRHRYRDF